MPQRVVAVQQHVLAVLQRFLAVPYSVFCSIKSFLAVLQRILAVLQCFWQCFSITGEFALSQNISDIKNTSKLTVALFK